MSPSITPHVFARLVGRDEETDVLLFEITAQFVDDAVTNEWSEPVQLRFVRRKGHLVELELHSLTDSYGNLSEPLPHSRLGERKKDT